MLTLLSKLHFLINIIIRIYNLLPIPVYHNLDRIKAYRRIFFLINFEAVKGDYLEFGVFEGTSLISAYYANKSTGKVDKLVMLNKPNKRRFIGFDSFEEGFKYFKEEDKHDNWIEGHLSSNLKLVKKRVSRVSKSDFILVKGFVENTLEDIKKNNDTIEGYKIEKVAVMLIDMDLKSPAEKALRFCHDKLQNGSIIIIDNYFNFNCDPNKGEFAAISNFIDYSKIKLIDFGNYGVTGKIFIVSKPT